MKKLTMDRVSCHVTARCNLRCKMCAVYIPKLYELGNVPEYPITEIKNSFRTYFALTDQVRLISITGGEPMLYPDLAELLDYLRSYEKSFSKLEVFTNGSLEIPDPVLRSMAEFEKYTLFVDNYGPQISSKVRRIQQQCAEFGVRYTVRTYFGENAHMGGWVDRSILPERLSDEKAREHSRKCAAVSPGVRLFTIFGHMLVFCATPYCGYRIGAVPASDVLGIDLGDSGMSLEEKGSRLREMCEAEFNPGCAWCNGMGIYENMERFVPGEQVKKNG